MRSWDAHAARLLVALLACVPACSLIINTSDLSNPASAQDGGSIDGSPSADGAANNDGATLPDGAPLEVDVIIAAGAKQTCAIAGNTISCWGENDVGQLGDGTTMKRASPTPLASVPPGRATAISTCLSSTCAVIAENVWCWGSSSSGQLGTGAPATSLVPFRVSDLSGPAVDVKVGNGFACALMKSGTVSCWGQNAKGQLGDGSTSTHATSSEVLVEGGALLEGASAISAGDDHACALLASGAPYCWGHNDHNLLSKTFADDHSTRATLIAGLPPGSKTTHLSIGGWHTCAVVLGGVWCWGQGTNGELGNGVVDSMQPLQVNTMSSGTTFIDATGGEQDGDATCAIRNGELLCWGRSNDGRLGAGQTNPTNTPAVVPLPSPPLRVSGGYGHFCAVLANAATYCWGRGVEGQIGDGALTTRPSPVPVTPLR